MNTLLLFALTEFVASLSPGPAVLLVISETLKYGTRSGLFIILGILLINILFFIISAMGLGAVLVQFPEAFFVIRVFGALYLLYLAYEIGKDVFLVTPDQSSMPVDTAEQNIPFSRKPYLTSVLKAMIVQGSNLKNIVFFLAIIPQFIDPSQDTLPQFAIIGTISVLVELPILLAYVLLTARFAELINRGPIRKGIDIISCLLLTIIAVSVVFMDV